MNYKGYFISIDCTRYRVNFIADTGDTEYTEIKLAGSSPFVVSYDVSDTPFEPYRGSTASINVVSDNYLFDLLSPHADGVIVELLKEVDPEVPETDVDHYELQWTGYLQGNVLNQPFSNCIESFALNANDCLKVLSHFDYFQITNLRQIATFKDIIVNIIERRLHNINHFYWSETKRDRNGSIIQPYELRISEQNFFSDDPEDEEPWKMDEVLAEMCRYIGMTAVQWKDAIYFIDYQYYSAYDTIEYMHFKREDDWENPESELVEENNEIVQDSYRGSGGNISMDACYNKIRVKDNFYFADLFIPDIYNDDALTNRFGEWWQCRKIEPQITGVHLDAEDEDMKHSAIYVDKKGQHKDTTDLAHHYYEKWYDHKHYSSVYRDPVLSDDTYETWWQSGLTTGMLTDITGSTIVTLTDAQKKEDRCMTRYQGGTIVDIATVERQPTSGASQWEWTINREATNSLNFDRYLCISTLGMPFHNGTATAELIPHVTPNKYDENKFPRVFELNRDHTCPVILDEGNSYITINGSAIWEKYFKRNFINPDWASDMSAIANEEENMRAITERPALFFKLKIGRYYWDGDNWVTGNTCFVVNTYTKFKTEEAEDGKFVYDGNWNEELEILNNVEWTEYADASGYKIPLPEGFDMSQEIIFDVHVPSLLQRRSCTRNDAGEQFYDDGLGYFCWVKNLQLNICNKYSTQTKDDVVYENEVDGYSINEMDEINCKFTTFPGKMQLSYSNVGIKKNTYLENMNGFLDYVKEEALSNALQKPEENIVEKYYNLYSKPVKREEITVDLSFNPLQKIVDTYWNEDFVMLGNEIDYGEGSQNISIIRLASACRLEVSHAGSQSAKIPAAGGAAEVAVRSTCPWTAVTDHSAWGEFDRTSGEGTGYEEFDFIMLPNTSPEERVITFTVTTGDKTAFTRFTQLGGYVPESLSINPSTMTFPAEGGTYTLSVDSNADWTINEN